MPGPKYNGRGSHLTRQKRVRDRCKVRDRHRRAAEHEGRIRALLAQLAAEDE